ncbi:MAG: histidine phosphatase family protein [Deltaproteobacteria bacterium]|jgi:broad specificity phosphatase PhoE|nr:histidine phosphatase family protein [Deltaproteobacteria bacterium]
MAFLRFYCVRHGETINYYNYTFNGWTDVALSEKGRLQLEEAVEAIKDLKFDAIYSSDLQRASYGAKVLSNWTKVEHTQLEGFREMNFGDCEGMPYKKIVEVFPQIADDIVKPQNGDFTFPNGESATSFRERIDKHLSALLAKHPTGQIILFSHSGVMRAILASLLSLSNYAMWAFEQDFASLNVLDVHQGGGLNVRLVNGYLGPSGYRQSGPGFERLKVPAQS